MQTTRDVDGNLWAEIFTAATTEEIQETMKKRLSELERLGHTLVRRERFNTLEEAKAERRKLKKYTRAERKAYKAAKK